MYRSARRLLLPAYVRLFRLALSSSGTTQGNRSQRTRQVSVFKLQRVQARAHWTVSVVVVRLLPEGLMLGAGRGYLTAQLPRAEQQLTGSC